MRRRKMMIGFLALVACGILVVAFWPEKPEPVYDGRKLSEWLRIVATSRNGWSEEHTKAIDALGTNSIPFLLEWLAYEPGLPKKAQFKLAEISPEWLPLQGPSEDSKLHRAWAAYSALTVFREKAEPAIPQLLSYATNFARGRGKGLPTDPDLSMYALIAIGRPAVPAILNLMTNENTNTRALIMRHAFHLCSEPSVLAQFERSLDDPDQEVRYAATNSLQAYKDMLAIQVSKP
jgi:hypothetical protein